MNSNGASFDSLTAVFPSEKRQSTRFISDARGPLRRYLTRALLYCLAPVASAMGAPAEAAPALAAYLIPRPEPDLSSNASNALARLRAEGTAVFTADDIQSVRATTESFWLILSGNHKRSSVIVRFKPAVAARIRDRLTYSVGECLALVAQDKVIQQQLITGPLADDEFQIAGSFTPEEAKALAKMIKAALR